MQKTALVVLTYLPKEAHEITRSGVNSLIEWTEAVSLSDRFPLPQLQQIKAALLRRFFLQMGRPFGLPMLLYSSSSVTIRP